ncbi:hypothetical protein [uncultured Methanobrevibacter sp.]|uniref:hypothetical protein n=1 Tax=uncultured Methanobrevibacter sp. TaxID=253161 RepID=UPI0025F8A3AA|nr:hypothetical protein [uncultured Methanobrevibacter sp.]
MIIFIYYSHLLNVSCFLIGGDIIIIIIIILEWYATWVNLAFPVCIFLLDYSLKELIRGLDEDFENYGW